MAHTKEPLTVQGDLIYRGTEYIGRAYTQDDARLFAAAPDLLDAVHMLLNEMRHVPYSVERIAAERAGRNAITNAEGTPAGRPHAETSAQDDPTQKPETLRDVLGTMLDRLEVARTYRGVAINVKDACIDDAIKLGRRALEKTSDAEDKADALTYALAEKEGVIP